MEAIKSSSTDTQFTFSILHACYIAIIQPRYELTIINHRRIAIFLNFFYYFHIKKLIRVGWFPILRRNRI